MRTKQELPERRTESAKRPALETCSAQANFSQVDHLNTPRLVTNDQQQAVWRWDQQEPFGINVPDENPSGLGVFDLPLRLPGQYFDKETNLAYNFFRDYDSGTGRYAQSDPIGLGGGLNTYAYVEGNPLSNVDPRGLDTISMLPMMNAMLNPLAPRQMCRPDDDCPDPITISFNGVCRTGDTTCAQAMKAAGIAGPYFPQTKTYSRKCLLVLGIGVKATSTVGSTILLNKAPTVAANLGAGASTVGALKATAAVANNPVTIAIGVVVAADQVMKQCECDGR